jgi:hypothetical protein
MTVAFAPLKVTKLVPEDGLVPKPSPLIVMDPPPVLDAGDTLVMWGMSEARTVSVPPPVTLPEVATILAVPMLALVANP